MTIARELVTLLRYEIDESGLNKFNKMRPNGGRAPNNVPGLPTPAVIDSTSTGLGRLGLMLRGLVAGISVISAARIADTWAGVEGRVGLVTDGIDEQKEALDGLYAAAQRSRQSYEGLASVFQGIARNKTELGLTTDQALALSETVGTAMTIGGGSASSQQAALVQLSQALGTGTLRGEELNSIMEQAPRLAQAIAKAFNVPVGKLKELGEKGKLSSKILAEGLLKQSATLREEFERMPMTFAGAWVVLANAMGRQIDKLNKNTGAAKIFYRVTSLVVDNLETIVKYLLWIGGSVVIMKIANAFRVANKAGGVFVSLLKKVGGWRGLDILLARFLKALSIATALYYVFDDISVWFRGGDSMLGRVIGPTNEWKWITDEIKLNLQKIQEIMGDTSSIETFVGKWGTVGVIIFGLTRLIGGLPTLFLAGLLGWISVFRTNWSQLGDDIMWGLDTLNAYLEKTFNDAWDTVKSKAKETWEAITTGLNGAWDSIKSKALEVWAEIGTAISNAVPDWARKGFNFVSNVVSGAVNNMGGGAAFGVTPAMMPNRTAGSVNTTTTQAPQVTVYATTPQPAAVAEAARRGTERGMSSAMVPNVEASR